MKEVTYTVIYEDGTIIENLSFLESYELFQDAFNTSNPAKVRTSEYFGDSRTD